MKLNILKLIIDAGPVVKFVMAILVFMSITSWAIILLKARVLKRARVNSEKFMEFFWAQKNLQSTYQRADQMAFCPVAALLKAGYSELMSMGETKRSKEEPLSPAEVEGVVLNVERALRRSATTQTTLLEKRTSFLATTGSSAPFIGLFGTVWGIMNSFLNIGATGASSLAVVAPGISEALVATAVGLFAAIPAVIGYNYCNAQIRVLIRDMESFSNDFLNIIKRQLGAK